MTATEGPPHLVLASRSPRRRALLRALGVAFETRESGIDEESATPASPAALAARLAVEKAEAVARGCAEGTLVLGADTVVALGTEIFNKPLNRADARGILERLSAREHTVFTGMALERARGATLAEVASARVTFKTLSRRLIEDYLASGEADDKAGAYGIQGLGSSFVERVEGDLTCVIGLPLGRLAVLYREMTGRDLFDGGVRDRLRNAFPELERLPADCLAGIPD